MTNKSTQRRKDVCTRLQAVGSGATVAPLVLSVCGGRSVLVLGSAAFPATPIVPSYRTGLVRLYGRMLLDSSTRVILAEQSLPTKLPGSDNANAAILCQWSGPWFDSFDCEITTVRSRGEGPPSPGLPRTEWTLKSSVESGGVNNPCGQSRVVTGEAVIPPVTTVEILEPNPSRRRVVITPELDTYIAAAGFPQGVFGVKVQAGDRSPAVYPLFASLASPGTPHVLIQTHTESITVRNDDIATPFSLAWIEESA